MKTSFLIFFFSLFFLNAPAQTPELVYIRIQEPVKMGGAFDPVMVVIKPDNTSETVALKKLGLGGSSLDENGVIIKNEIAKWLGKGFKLITVNSSGGDMNRFTEIFLKKE